MMKYMARALSLFAIGAIIAVSSLRPVAAQTKEPSSAMMAPVYAAVIGETGAVEMLTNAYTSDPTIVDEFAPYEWSGPNAVRQYASDLHAWLRAGNLKSVHVTFDAVRFWDTKGDRAWITMPATFSFTINGKLGSESGTYAFVLVRINGAWKAKSSSWATTSFASER